MLNNKLFSEILLSIAPTSEELILENKFAKDILSRISKKAPKGAEVRLMGSVAKGTFLKENKDLDAFILFKSSVKHENFESIIKKVAFSAFPKEKKEIGYAEHPYVRIYCQGRKIDLVPAYNVKSANQIASSVDRSVLHVKYILKKLNGKKKMQVLMLKKFLRSNGLYGAEIRIQGFSGYLCELLIIKYGSFYKCIKQISRWRPPVFIDIEKHYKKNNQIVFDKFKGSSLVVVDPVDKNRNVASVVSEENFLEFVSISRKFLKNPSKKFFELSSSQFAEKKKQGFMKLKGRVYHVSIKNPGIVDDILWGQLRKFSKNIVFSLESLGFVVSGVLLDSTDFTCDLFIRLKSAALPDKMLLKGPPLDLEKNVIFFMKKHKGARFVKKSKRIYAVCKREVRYADIAFKKILNNHALFPSHLDPNSVRLKKFK